MSDFLKLEEIAEMLQCEPETVLECARSGKLPAVKFGRSWVFPREAFFQRINELALANKPAVRARGVERGTPPPPLPDLPMHASRPDRAPRKKPSTAFSWQK